MLRVNILIVFYFIIQSLFSQDFEVVVSDNKVGLNESFEISFILNESGKSFTPPPFSDFQILRGPSKSSSTSIINGQMSQETSYSYVLKPLKIGVFTILPASIKVKGKTIGTKPVTIQVQKGISSKKPNTPYNQVVRKVHLEVTSNKQTCYVGEPIVLSYTLYFNLNVGNVSQNPIEYNGFLVNNIDINSSTTKRQFKGERYNSALIKQVVLVPQKSGKQEIENLKLDLVASVPTGKRDFFNMTMTQQIDFTAVSNSIIINVLELPKEGMPNNFSGAIGDFKLSTHLDKDSIGLNESALFSVKVTGSGNLTLINTPQVLFNEKIEIFDPKNLDDIKINNKGIKGYKKEEYLLVPRHKGTYNLSPITFNFFNPKTKKYITLKSQAKTIQVTGGQQFDDAYTLESVNKEKIDLINEDIKYIKINKGVALIQGRFVQSRFFYVCISLALIILLFAILYKKNNIDFNLFFKKNTLQYTLDNIASLEILLVNKNYEKFQSELLRILLFYISDSFSIQKGHLSSQNIEKILRQKSISTELVSECIAIIQYLERCKYSPHKELEVNKDLYNRVLRVINNINEML